MGNCAWGQTEVAIVILRFALERAIEEREEAIEAYFKEDDVEVDKTACDIVETKIRIKLRNLKKVF